MRSSLDKSLFYYFAYFANASIILLHYKNNHEILLTKKLGYKV